MPPRRTVLEQQRQEDLDHQNMEEAYRPLVVLAPTVSGMTDQTIPEDYRLAILGTETSNTVAVMITDLPDPRLLVDFVEMNTGPATDPLRGTIAGRDDARDRRMEGVGDTRILVQRIAGMTATQICQFPEEPHGMCRTFK